MQVHEGRIPRPLPHQVQFNNMGMSTSASPLWIVVLDRRPRPYHTPSTLHCSNAAQTIRSSASFPIDLFAPWFNCNIFSELMVSRGNKWFDNNSVRIVQVLIKDAHTLVGPFCS